MGQRSGTGQQASPGCCLPQRCGVKWPCPGAKCPFPLVLSHPHYSRRTCSWVCRRRPLFWKSLPWSRAQGGSSPTTHMPSLGRRVNAEIRLAEAGRDCHGGPCKPRPPRSKRVGPRGEVLPPSFTSRRRRPRPPLGGGVFAGLLFCFFVRAERPAGPGPRPRE